MSRVQVPSAAPTSNPRDAGSCVSGDDACGAQRLGRLRGRAPRSTSPPGPRPRMADQIASTVTRVLSDLVVDVVPSRPEQDPAHARQAADSHEAATEWHRSERVESSRQLLDEEVGCARSIRLPPRIDHLHVALCARRELDLHARRRARSSASARAAGFVRPRLAARAERRSSS